ncbi:MAG: YihY/virulence factor BrkB family protein, partial [Paracoccaceae bacterium]|nr:YihY/virulence factor BrkB family protein [Paracoccaceae bacterium]
RHVALSRVFSIAIVLIGFAVFVLLAVLIIFAPLVFALIEQWTTIRIPIQADLIRYLIAMFLLGTALWAMHRLLPSRPMAGLRLWPGVVASVLIWGAAATLLSVYLAFAPSYAVTYGTLAGVIVTLLFFYLTGLALIFGAEVNATINQHLLVPVSGEDAKPEIEKRMGL